jgi:hypothetical protein
MIVLCTSAHASLGTVNLSGYNYSFADQATITGGGISGMTGYTGVYQWTATAGTGLGAYVPNWGFCTELTEGVLVGPHEVLKLEDAPNYTTNKADKIRELWGRYFDASWTTGSNKKYAEAFNACIWEIVHETDSSWNVNSGTVFFGTNLEQAATANTWLASLNGTGDMASNLYVLHDGQDFLVQIPEPATMVLLGLGGVFSLISRKRKTA